MRNQVVYQRFEITNYINQTSFPWHCRIFLTALHLLEHPDPPVACISLRNCKSVCAGRLFCWAGRTSRVFLGWYADIPRVHRATDICVYARNKY